LGRVTCFDKAKEASKIIFVYEGHDASKNDSCFEGDKKLLKNYHLASTIKPVTHTVCSSNKRSK
jgi:hypothetical protein